jgi:poly(beta-D-mannuronate) lyase
MISRRMLVGALGGCAFGRQITVRTPAEVTYHARHAQPGDQILLRAGEWRDADLTVIARGRPARPVFIAAEAPGAVVFTGASRLRVAGEHVEIIGFWWKDCTFPGDLISFRVTPQDVANHCALERCVITNAVNDSKLTTRWVSLYGTGHTVLSCYFAGKRNPGPTMVVWLREGPYTAGHRIVSNWLGPRPPLGQNGGETIRVGDSATSHLRALVSVTANYFEQCDGEMEIISNKSGWNRYRQNVFDRCAGTLTLRHGDGCLVDANIFLGGGAADTGGVRIIGRRHKVANNYFHQLTGKGFRAAISLVNGLPDSPANGYFAADHARVLHNTIVNCAESIVVGANNARGELSIPLAGAEIGNNLISGSGALRVVDPRTGFQSEGNHFDVAGSIGADGLWHPAAAIPAVARHTETSDIHGRARILSPHAGCEQFPPPAKSSRAGPQNTGPLWWRERFLAK